MQFTRIRTLPALWAVTLLAAAVGFSPGARAQSTETELDDMGAPYTVTTIGGDDFFVFVVDLGGASMDVDCFEDVGMGVAFVGTVPAISIAGGPFINGAALIFMGTTADLEVHIGSLGDDATTNQGADAGIYFGLDGDDEINCADVPNLVFGGDDADIITGGGYEDQIWTGFRSIAYAGAGGSGTGNEVYADDADDMIIGDASLDYIEGGNGNDYIEGGGNLDEIFGQGGCDDIWGDAGVFILFGPFGGAWGTAGADTINGGGEDDLIVCGGGDDYADGNDGNDAIDGGPGQDDLYGGDGADYLHDMDTTAGDDLFGDDDNDILHSNDGADDDLDGGAGTDYAYHSSGDSVTNCESTSSASNPSGYAFIGTPEMNFLNYTFNEYWLNMGRTCQ